MADKILVLSKRPSTIKNIHTIQLSLNGEGTPLARREAPEFKDYFNTIWKELDVNEQDKFI